jgi:hypothetical protein
MQIPFVESGFLAPSQDATQEFGEEASSATGNLSRYRISSKLAAAAPDI